MLNQVKLFLLIGRYDVV